MTLLVEARLSEETLGFVFLFEEEEEKEGRRGGGVQGKNDDIEDEYRGMWVRGAA